MPASSRLVLGCIAIALPALLAATASAQAVYTWKDAKGVTHYSDAPPPSGAREVRVPTPPPVPAPASASARAARPAPPVATTANRAPEIPVDPAAVAARDKQRKEICTNAQNNLTLLQGNAGIAVDRDGDGKMEAVLDQPQRQKEIENMQAAVQANCTPSG